VNLLHTERLELVPVTPGNAHLLWAVMQSPHLREYQDVPRLTREDFVTRVARRPRSLDRRANGRFEWLIVPRKENPKASAAGWVSLRISDRANACGELGYTLLRERRGNGFGREAVAAVVDYAFKGCVVDRIEACCVPANAPSRAVLRQLGFAEERTLPNGAVVRGRAVDVLLHSISSETWKAQTPSANSIVIPASAKP
jgi:ribosomal-protein-alanine N-acetyltransferase